jgi:hypothetical protein
LPLVSSRETTMPVTINQVLPYLIAALVLAYAVFQIFF